MKWITAVLAVLLIASGLYPVQQSSAQGCTVVELYPGYPGYRGVVAGLIGRGDTACLEDLQFQDPNFDMEAEDEANVAAALRLGVTGPFTDWTWETWAAIGELRRVGSDKGFYGICYFCLMLDPSVVPVGPELFTGPDPRLQNSLRPALLKYFQITGKIDPDPQAIVEIFSPRDWDRVRGYLFSELSLPSAEALNRSVQASQDVVIINEGRAGCIVEMRGGYAYTSPAAHPKDQMWSITLGMLPAPVSNGPLPKMVVIAGLSLAIRNWPLSDNIISFNDYFMQFGGRYC